MKTGEVYKITCSKNNLVYVGSTTRGVRQRWLEHLHYLRHGTHKSKAMQTCFIDHGEDSFSYEVLESGVDEASLLLREQFHITENKCRLLNSKPFAESYECAWRVSMETGAAQTDEVKAKRVQSIKQYYLLNGRRSWTELQRARHSVRLTGRKMPPVSEETKRKISEANKGKPCSQEAIASSVKTRTAFIDDEVATWVKMKDEGMSFREIERITGRTRKVVAREYKRFKDVERGAQATS